MKSQSIKISAQELEQYIPQKRDTRLVGSVVADIMNTTAIGTIDPDHPLSNEIQQSRAIFILLEGIFQTAGVLVGLISQKKGHLLASVQKLTIEDNLAVFQWEDFIFTVDKLRTNKFITSFRGKILCRKQCLLTCTVVTGGS